MIRKFLKALTKTILVVLLSAALLLALLQNSYVQSFIAKSGALYLSNQLGVEIFIQKIRISGFFKIALKNVHINDHHHQPMITAKNIYVDLPLIQGISDKIPINSIQVDSAFVQLVRYTSDNDINISKVFSSNSLDSAMNQTDSIPSNPIILTLDRLDIRNSHFIYKDETSVEYYDYGMNYTDLDISDINVEIEDVLLIDDSIMGQIKHLGAKEKCGIVLNHLEGLANVSSKGTIIEEAILQTPSSNIHLDLSLLYSQWSAYLDFINEVQIQSDIRHSQLNLDDISYFASTMQGMDNLLRINGEVSGPVRNLKARNLELSYGESTKFHGNAQISGLPNIYESFINLKIQDALFSIQDLKQFNLPNGEKLDQIPDEIRKFGTIRIKGRYTGFYNDFVSNADIYTDLGKLYTNIQFQNKPKENMLYYKGEFKARNFDLGQFLEREYDFGEINFDLNINGKGLSLNEIEADIEGRIDSMDFRNNPINTIYVDAHIEENQFKGALDLQDNLLNVDFTGLIDFDSVKPLFDFNAYLNQVKLAELGLLEIDPTASLSTHINLNFTGDNIDQFEGRISIDSTEFYYIDRNYYMDSLHLYSEKSIQEEGDDIIRIESDFMRGSIQGKYKLADFFSSFEQLTQNYVDNFEFIDNDTSLFIDESFALNFDIFNTDELTQLFIPELELQDTLHLTGHFYNRNSDFFLKAFTPVFSYNNLIFDQFNFKVQTNVDTADFSLDIDKFIFKKASKSDSLELGVDRLNFGLLLHENTGDFKLKWDNQKSRPRNFGNIQGKAHFINNKSYQFDLNKFKVIVNDSSWHLNAPSVVKIDTSSILFDSLSFVNETSSILLHGAISESLEESFLADFDHFDIQAFNLLLLSSGISLSGLLSGQFQLIDAYNSAGFLTDMKLKDFVLNGEALGDAEIKSTWNSDQSIFMNLNLVKQGNKGEYKPLYAEGYYYPSFDENQLDVDISLHNLSINFLNPFLKSFVSDLEGNATGNISVKGSLSEPDLKGQLDLARTQFRIIYLNTLYSLSGKLMLTNEMLGFNQVSLYDTLGNIAQLSGGLTHNRLKGFGVDLKVSPENFIALNTRKGMNSLFYGKAVVSGDLFIKGPFDNIYLDINASSRRGTDLKIPINTTLGVSENNFIVFVNKNDTVNKLNEKKFVPQLSNFSLNMDLNITPDAKIEISLPSQLGEIQATGFGDLNMNLSRTGNFRMSGDYRVSDGLFFFRIRNLLNRKFTLKEGGTISWTGDPYSGILGMKATYDLKTSLNSLGLEQDSSYRNRVPVECIIGLSGPIMDPNIKFNFEFPNATEEVKQYVYTKIDTTNSSEMSQQMLSLLVFNSFSFNNGTGNTSLANNVTGSSMQIVANQLSNWLSQISKDVDIGINYRPGGDLTNEEVEVALSTQLFDERVTIDGNFGYQNVQDNPSANTSSIVGDINVEVKITNDGRLRLKAFNRTNTVDLLDNTSPYTQGVGIFYRKEFNNLTELFTNQRKQERKKKEEALEKSKARMNEEENKAKTEED